MKFLHLADIHLGRSLHEQSLEEDQRSFIDQLVATLAGDDWAGLILAGDIYDRSLPSKEAVSLLDELLLRLHEGFPKLPILIIPGNHDSPRRLAYGQELFSKLGIHIVADPEAAFEPILVEKDGERCACFLLPFLEPGCLRAPTTDPVDSAPAPGEPLRSQWELHQEAGRRLETARQKAMREGADYSLLVAHLFAGGGRESESERHFLGTAEMVDIGAYRAFDYIALGHLHRRQRAADNAWYAGSPLAWAFDEAGSEKGGLALTLHKSDTGTGDAEPRFSVEPINFAPLHPLARIGGSMEDILDGRFESRGGDSGDLDYRSCYLEVQLEGSELVENPLALLRQKFPLLLSVRQDRAFESLAQSESAEDIPLARGDRQDLKADFDRFLGAIYGSDHGREEEAALFARLLEECANEEQHTVSQAGSAELSSQTAVSEGAQ